MVLSIAAILGHLDRHCFPDDFSTFASTTLQYRLAVFLGETAFKHLKSRRKTAARNLEVCFPEWSAAQVQDNTRQVFIDQMIGIFETLDAWYCPYWFKGRFSIEGLEHLQKGAGRGSRCVIARHSFNASRCGRLSLRSVFQIRRGLPSAKQSALGHADLPLPRDIYEHQIDHDDMRGLIRQLKNGHAIWYSPDQDFGLKQGIDGAIFWRTCSHGDCAPPFNENLESRSGSPLFLPRWRS